MAACGCWRARPPRRRLPLRPALRLDRLHRLGLGLGAGHGLGDLGLEACARRVDVGGARGGGRGGVGVGPQIDRKQIRANCRVSYSRTEQSRVVPTPLQQSLLPCLPPRP